MSAPATPSTFYVQQGNGQVLVSWGLVSGATSYKVYRATDGITFSLVQTVTTGAAWADTAVTVGTLYYYNLKASNGSGDSAATSSLSIVPSKTGILSLSEVRLLAQQEADMENATFVSLPEWNKYINQSYFELYDLLTTLYEDYFVAAPAAFQTTSANLYTLPDGTTTFLDSTNTPYVAPSFYKLLGVDLGLANQSNAWVTIQKFDFIGRNRYVFPQLTASYMGVFNLRYRVMGSNIMFIPPPSAGQYVRLWYIPRVNQLLNDTDMLDGVSGWTEYVIVDAAIKALEKEESDTSALMGRKMGLIKRVEESAMNRDAGQPDTVSDTRSWSERYGGYGSPNGDGSFGGF